MGKLFIVPTPIGNLEDITLRAINVLKEADLILSEDTRVSNKLLNHYNISKKLSSFHINNEHKILNQTVKKIQENNITVLISDAGTPAISDPGFLLVRACVENNIEITCLPGATAFVPALVMSSFPCNNFVFEGFLPHKKGKLTKVKEISISDKTVVLYESPHRLLKTLIMFNENFEEDRLICVVREISKLFEQCVRGKVGEVLKYFSENEDKVKGEFVIVIDKKK